MFRIYAPDAIYVPDLCSGSMVRIYVPDAFSMFRIYVPDAIYVLDL